MLILAIESSAKPASVAVIKSDDNGIFLLGQYFQNNGFSHSKTLMPMAEALLNNLSLKPNDIDKIAVAKGPGSFTGVRIGVSAAKGLAYGLDIPVCGISTLEAMASQTKQPDAIICPVMDARRNQVYNALFEWKDNSFIRLCNDRAISIEDLLVELNNFDKPCLPVGDGSDLLTAKIQDVIKFKSLNLITPCSLMKYQTAYGVAIASLYNQSIPAVELEPSYLRPSQAEREAIR